MPAAKTAPARARSFRLTRQDEDLLDRLAAHFSGDIPATPSDVLRLALRRLAEAELGRKAAGRRP